MKKRYAALAITKHGVLTVRRLLADMRDLDVFYPAKFAIGDEAQLGIQLIEGPVVASARELFHQYQGLIGFVALGAMVRIIAPLVQDKKTDPAVVVIDDRAQYVISVLSGHLGGANDLTRRLARLLDAEAVITTASDVGETVAVDLLGRQFGFVIEDFSKVVSVSAAVVNEEPVVVIQESGERNWWSQDRLLPANFRVRNHCDAAWEERTSAYLVITHRLLSDGERDRFLENGVLYRPKSLVVGVGCNRGTSAQEIEQVIEDTLLQSGLSIKSVRNLATIDLKGDEPGLLEACAKHGWRLVTYTVEQLNTIPLPHPSEKVFQYVGCYGVSEAAARLSSGAEDWLVEKTKSGNVTVSVCLAAS